MSCAMDFTRRERTNSSQQYNAWNYAIRGRTVDRRDLRVIVSFDEDGMLLITTIEVEK